MTKGRSFAASTVDGYTQRASQISYHFIRQAAPAGNRAFCGGRGRYRPSGENGKTRDGCHRPRTGNRSVGDRSRRVAYQTRGSWRAGLSERECPYDPISCCGIVLFDGNVVPDVVEILQSQRRVDDLAAMHGLRPCGGSVRRRCPTRPIRSHHPSCARAQAPTSAC